MAVSELPGNPNAVWTVKKNIDGKCFFYCRMLSVVFSFMLNYVT